MTASGGSEAPGSLKALRSVVAESVVPGTDLNNLPAEGFVPGGES